MTQGWADELPQQPVPAREEFYLLVSLKLGSPDESHWIRRNSDAFYKMWDEWTNTKMSGAYVLIEYLLWYERERPKS